MNIGMQTVKRGRWRLLAAAVAMVGGVSLTAAVAPNSVSAGSPDVEILDIYPAPDSMNEYLDGTPLIVVGTGEPGYSVAVAECNFDVGGMAGTNCNGGAGNFAVATVNVAGYWVAEITVDEGFADFDFTMNSPSSPANNTTCDNLTDGDQCQVQASMYEEFPPTGGPVDTDGEDIWFQ